MSKIRAIAFSLGVCSLLAAGGDALADGFRFGHGWRFGGPLLGRLLRGPRFGAPYFAGPRFDGPGAYDEDIEPLPRLHPQEPRPAGPRRCYSQAETREKVAAEKLPEPFSMMRAAAAYAHGEALNGKLCRWNDLDIYDISLLRPDGRVVHVFMNAATGQVVGSVNAH